MKKFKVVEKTNKTGEFLIPTLVFEDGTTKTTEYINSQNFHTLLRCDALNYLRANDFKDWGEEQILKLFDCYCYLDNYYHTYNNNFAHNAAQCISDALSYWNNQDKNDICPKELRYKFLISLLQRVKSNRDLTSLYLCFAINIPTNDQGANTMLSVYWKNGSGRAFTNNYTWKEIADAWKIARFLNKYQSDVTVGQIIEILNEQAKMLGYETVDLNRQYNQELAD